ncbi:MAG: TetR family transcriptional regulator [Pseudonocardiaceae bacterium]|nr:TetR family transcriptional regulator [Pseudonocardiaceae bacterium]
MGRPPRHDLDQLLDAAAKLAAESGPHAVTMSAVARAVGAPSGSVYHRFADRPALLAALWLRTVRRFQEGVHAALAHDSPRRAAVEAAKQVVAWSRKNPEQARVLLYGARDFGSQDWTAMAHEELRNANAEVERGVRALAERLALPVAKVMLVVVDLPYAVVRRQLVSGKRVPPSAVDLVVDAAGALLDAP